MMFNIKKIRKQTTKARIKTIKNYIKWSAERGEDRMEINLKDPYYSKDIRICADEHVINYLKSKGFEIKQDDKSVIISWK